MKTSVMGDVREACAERGEFVGGEEAGALELGEEVAEHGGEEAGALELGEGVAERGGEEGARRGRDGVEGEGGEIEEGEGGNSGPSEREGIEGMVDVHGKLLCDGNPALPSAVGSGVT